jgi:hypothetical protein
VNHHNLPTGTAVDRQLESMMDEGEREKDDYAPYLTPVWGYLVVFLIIIPIVLYLGHRFGGNTHGF